MVTINDSAYTHRKIVKVACALIEDDLGNILVAQRSSKMSLPLKWEFPGGKVEENETVESTIIREIYEELNLQITIIEQLPSFIHHYEDFSITLIPFICQIEQGAIKLVEHKAFCWASPDNLLDLDLAAADIPVALYYLNILKK